MELLRFNIKLTSHRRNFRQIILEHSDLMCHLAKSKYDGNLKEMMNLWVRINALTDEWAYKITCKNNEISKETRELIMSYSDVLCDVIIQGKPDLAKIERIIKLEAKFLSVIGKMSTLKEWFVYTNCILIMIRNVNDEYAIRDCLNTGKGLGDAMDRLFYDREKGEKDFFESFS